MATNHISSNRTLAGAGMNKQMPEAIQASQRETLKDIFRDPFTFVLLVWAVMIAVAGVCWILS